MHRFQTPIIISFFYETLHSYFRLKQVKLLGGNYSISIATKQKYKHRILRKQGTSSVSSASFVFVKVGLKSLFSRAYFPFV